ncbi:MAG: glycosyltransferase family 2 protein [Egibacteraceae bacterium]
MGDSLLHRLAPQRLRARAVRTVAHAAEWGRERLESLEERRLLEKARAGRPVCWVDDGEPEPLITVRIATYDRGPLVVERSIASVITQTYERLEILVIGDACTPATAQAVASVKDPRIRFVNLPCRGTYPADPRQRRMVAGSHPMNAGLYLARGAWIAPCDDDDELTPDHVEVLLAAAKTGRYEMVYSKARYEQRPGQWRIVGSEPLRLGEIVHGSVLYSAGLRFMRHSNTSWKMSEPADWNMWQRMRRIGVRIGFVDRVTYTLNIGAVERERHATRSTQP